MAFTLAEGGELWGSVVDLGGGDGLGLADGDEGVEEGGGHGGYDRRGEGGDVKGCSRRGGSGGGSWRRALEVVAEPEGGLGGTVELLNRDRFLSL